MFQPPPPPPDRERIEAFGALAETGRPLDAEPSVEVRNGDIIDGKRVGHLLVIGSNLEDRQRHGLMPFSNPDDVVCQEGTFHQM